MSDVLAFSALFALATAAFGFALGSCFDGRERAVQIFMPASILLLFLTGYPWPSNGIAAGLRALRWVFPSTAGIVGLTQICQMGASWSESAPEVIALTAITVVATPLALLQLRLRASRAER